MLSTGENLQIYARMILSGKVLPGIGLAIWLGWAEDISKLPPMKAETQVRYFHTTNWKARCGEKGKERFFGDTFVTSFSRLEHQRE